MELSLATTEDMIAELGRRGLTAAIIVSHLTPDYAPSADVPAGDAVRVYFTDGGDERQPTAHGAAFLCVGIVSCFNEILAEGTGDVDLDIGTLTRISGTLREVAAELEALAP